MVQRGEGTRFKPYLTHSVPWTFVVHYCSNHITAEYLHWLSHQLFQPITAAASRIKYQLQLKAGVILELAPFREEREMLRTCNVMLIRFPKESNAAKMFFIFFYLFIYIFISSIIPISWMKCSHAGVDYRQAVVGLL